MTDATNCMTITSAMIAPIVFNALTNYETLHRELKTELVDKLNSEITVRFIDKILRRKKKVVTEDNIFYFLYDEGNFLSEDGWRYTQSLRTLGRLVELHEFVNAFDGIESIVRLSESDVALIKRYL